VPVVAAATDDAGGKTPTWVWVAGAVVLAVLAVWVLR
jgi:MYXO-CTERM domain-containing protein